MEILIQTESIIDVRLLNEYTYSNKVEEFTEEISFISRLFGHKPRKMWRNSLDHRQVSQTKAGMLDFFWFGNRAGYIDEHNNIKLKPAILIQKEGNNTQVLNFDTYKEAKAQYDKIVQKLNGIVITDITSIKS